LYNREHTCVVMAALTFMNHGNKMHSEWETIFINKTISFHLVRKRKKNTVDIITLMKCLLSMCGFY